MVFYYLFAKLANFPFHLYSVEDIQWSPAAGEGSLFASCSVDKSIRLWDSRTRKANDGLWLRGAHNADVNVMSWNKMKTFLIASGGDDGTFKVREGKRGRGEEGEGKENDC